MLFKTLSNMLFTAYSQVVPQQNVPRQQNHDRVPAQYRKSCNRYIKICNIEPLSSASFLSSSVKCQDSLLSTSVSGICAQRFFHGPRHAQYRPMSALVYKAGKRGICTKATLVAANHSEQPHFGLADGVIVSIGLLFVGALACLLLLLS